MGHGHHVVDISGRTTGENIRSRVFHRCSNRALHDGVRTVDPRHDLIDGGQGTQPLVVIHHASIRPLGNETVICGYKRRMDKDKARQLLEEEKTRLTRLRDEIESDRPGDLREQSGELTTNDGDIGSETFERQRDASLVAGLNDELADVEAALAKLDGDNFGLCEACGTQIKDERLEARPHTRFCVDHQQQAERQGS